MKSFLKASRPLFLLACAMAFAPAYVAGAAVPDAAAASTPALALTLREHVQLDHARIVLGDVATLADGASAELASLDLGPAPRVNAIERISRAQIALLVRRRLQQPVLAWSGADSVSVQRLSQPVPGSVLGDAAVAALLDAYGARFPGLQASAPALPADVDIIFGGYTVKARALDASRLPARAAVWLDLMVAGQVQRSVVVPVTLAWQRPVYVARRALPAGSMVQSGDFEVREQNVAGLDAQPVAGTGTPGWRLRRAMVSGQVLARGLLPASGTVFPGDTVRLQARSGAIGIDVAAVVQAEAAPGQLVAVRALHSSDTLTGRLSAAGTVLIE